MKLFALLLAALVLAGCSSAPQRTSSGLPPSTGKGGYYKDDGPGDNVPANVGQVADAVPRDEPLHRFANRPYTVFGKDYVPISTRVPYRERGIASWYGKKFHGQKTSSGEIYDMYAMTAAHKTLPIPSYARVTNLANGKSVVVRVNDRGPFHSERIIDLSYAAAYKLGYIGAGSARVEVESVSASTPKPATVTATVPPAVVKEVATTPPPTAVPLAEAPASAAVVADPVPAQPGVYLQMGAFSSRPNAEDYRNRVATQLAWLTENVQVLSIGNLWRLHVGPYKTSEEARAVAARIEAELNLKPLVVAR